MRRTDYNLPIFDDTDIADLNNYTKELAEALKGQIDRFGNPLTFRGIVETIEDLPEEATAGDIYNVTDINKNYVFSGEEWLEYSDAIYDCCEDMISDQYDNTKTYAIRDYCIKDNILYRCNANTTGNWDSTKWTTTTIANELEKLDTATSDSGWIDLPLQNAVENLQNTDAMKARYRKIGNQVFIAGCVQNITADNTVIATLPAGYRPINQQRYVTGRNASGSSILQIGTNGQITFVSLTDNASVSSTTYIYIQNNFLVN